MQFEIKLYGDKRDNAPLADFLESLGVTQPTLYRMTSTAIGKLADSRSHGPPFTQQVDAAHGIYELRVGRANIVRIFFFFQSEARIILTNGYVKKRQKLDRGELDRARRYKVDWEDRYP